MWTKLFLSFGSVDNLSEAIMKKCIKVNNIISKNITLEILCVHDHEGHLSDPFVTF